MFSLALTISALSLPGTADAATPVMGTVTKAFSTSADLTANIESPVGETYWRFDISTNETDWTMAENVSSDPNPVFSGQEIHAYLTNLEPETKYFVRFAVFDTGSGEESISTGPYPSFTTTAPVTPTAPALLATNNASEVAFTTAKATGKVERAANEDHLFDANCTFEYLPDAQFTENQANSLPSFEGAAQAGCKPKNPVEAPGASDVEAILTGLSPETTYHLRLSVSNTAGADTKAAAATFTTLAPIPAPTVLTAENASEVLYTTVEATGKIKRPGGPGGADPALDTTCAFEYISDAQFEENVNVNAVPGFEGATPVGCEQGPFKTPGEEPTVSAKLTGLAPGTTYHLRLSASNSGGTDSKAAAGTFATKPVAKPTVTLDPITVFTDSAATFAGKVEANAPGVLTPAAEAAFRADWHIACNPACPNLSPDGGTGSVTAAEGSDSFSIDATELEPDTTYEITLEAANAGGPASVTKTVATTTIAPTVKPALGASDGRGGYTLQGIVNPHNSTLSVCKFEYGPNVPYAFSAPCSPFPGEVNKPTTVEAHLTGLTPGATYHAQLVVTNSAGTEKTADQIFVPTLDPVQNCPNETLRQENSSLALPECRAYEQVSAPNKTGYPAIMTAYFEGASVGYFSAAGNINNSGQGVIGTNSYVANRSSSGWETIPNLNGPGGSIHAGPEALFGPITPQLYAEDLQTSFWFTQPGGLSNSDRRAFLREPDGSFTLIGNGIPGRGQYYHQEAMVVGSSADLSHLVLHGRSSELEPPVYGSGIYEFVGTGNDFPRRVDVDNSGQPISNCGPRNAQGNQVSKDGSTIFFTATGGCGGSSPAAAEVWARVDGTTSYDASQSHCTRTTGDPGGACNAPAPVRFQGAATDGSSVYFTTTQQLVDGDTDETNDLYVYYLPTASNPSPSPTLVEVTGASGEAQVEEEFNPFGGAYTLPGSISDDGSTAYFVASGVLAGNEDAFKETAVAGHHNLYVWRRDGSHPAGEVKFVGRLLDDDLTVFASGQNVEAPQATPDGRYLVLTTATPLVPTDSDNARDVYRYDADTETMTRVSTNTVGVGGNRDGLDAEISRGFYGIPLRHSHPSVSADGQTIVFTTTEALSALDGNEAPDVYVWKSGRVSPITPGAVGGGGTRPSIDESGQNIYFTTPEALSPSDGDQANDIYDARVGGGFSFPEPGKCSGEGCQPPAPGPPPSPNPATVGSPAVESKPKPSCPKGKVLKKGHCVKKKVKKHHKKPHKKAKRATRGSRGGAE